MNIENFTAKYNDKVVFSNFNLKLNDGEITCILGNSGVGKTTIINHIISTQQKLNKKVAVSYQEPRLFEHLTVYENLKIIGYSDTEINSVLQNLGLDSCAKSYPNKLSGGEKQRVNLARALLLDFDILLLDEPFVSLDVKLKINIIEYICKKFIGKTIVFVTHDIDEALMLSNRIILIKNGEVLLDYIVNKDIKDRKYGKLAKEREDLINAQLV